jgi:hypothetical protein
MTPKTIERVNKLKVALKYIRFNNSLGTLARKRRFAACHRKLAAHIIPVTSAKV